MRWMIALLCVGITSASRLTAQSPDEVSRLGWLSGCWELRTATRVTHEQWMSPLGGALIGM
ncbi:MAG: DUF6265 family protein, partial [Gemmatimonadaceae bacterium]|nr:DUF6265 family protein [Gemmatimonadaceae bacterium]